jgi:hypothetical protein
MIPSRFAVLGRFMALMMAVFFIAWALKGFPH